jgi:hypothetical protein
MSLHFLTIKRRVSGTLRQIIEWQTSVSGSVHTNKSAHPKLRFAFEYRVSRSNIASRYDISEDRVFILFFVLLVSSSPYLGRDVKASKAEQCLSSGFQPIQLLSEFANQSHCSAELAVFPSAKVAQKGSQWVEERMG